MTKWGVVKLLLAVLVVVGAITTVTYEEKQATTKYQRECQEHVSKILTGSGENDKARTDECKDAKDYMTWWYILVAWPEGITTWALLFTLGVIIWQAKKTADATEAMRDSIPLQKKAADAAKISADAAKVSADIAARISVPTLKIEKFGFGYTGSANMAAILQFPNVEVVIKNYGQTPAFLRSWTIIFTCEELPEVPVYTDYPGCGIVLEKEVVKPGESYTLPKLDSFRRQKFSDEDIKAILNRERLFVAYGYVCYGDLFGNPPKRHKFCEFVLNIGDNWAQWSDSFSGPPYIGTDDLPIKQAASGQGIEGQPTRADAKTENHPEKAN
jgi:hypothetical protein